jgi:hypothetical protein
MATLANVWIYTGNPRKTQECLSQQWSKLMHKGSLGVDTFRKLVNSLPRFPVLAVNLTEQQG